MYAAICLPICLNFVYEGVQQHVQKQAISQQQAQQQANQHAMWHALQQAQQQVQQLFQQLQLPDAKRSQIITYLPQEIELRNHQLEPYLEFDPIGKQLMHWKSSSIHLFTHVATLEGFLRLPQENPLPIGSTLNGYLRSQFSISINLVYNLEAIYLQINTNLQQMGADVHPHYKLPYYEFLPLLHREITWSKEHMKDFDIKVRNALEAIYSAAKEQQQ